MARARCGRSCAGRRTSRRAAGAAGVAGPFLPGNFEIKEGKLRGVVSGGMMCSGKELGIGEDTGGLMILDASLPVGKPFKELVNRTSSSTWRSRLTAPTCSAISASRVSYRL